MTDGVAHVFVAGQDLDVVDSGGLECALSEGDALQLARPLAAGETAASLVVLSGKGGQECRRGAAVSVALADLQEMQNHMRETIDQGMGELQSRQSGGLPPMQARALAAPTKAPFAVQAPGPDPYAATEIAGQMQEAAKAEQEVSQEAAASPWTAGDTGARPAVAAAPPPVTLGQTIEEVIAARGEPPVSGILDLGQKKIYIYQDVKITFAGGKAIAISSNQ
jgi:hypothetical protein